MQSRLGTLATDHRCNVGVKCFKQKRIQQRCQRWHQQRKVRPKLPVLDDIGRIAAEKLGHEDLQRVRHKQVLSDDNRHCLRQL